VPTRRRSFLIGLFVAVGALILEGMKKAFDYAAAPDKEKESDFVFPRDSLEEKGAIEFADAKLPIPLVQRRGFTNDASHLNRTAIYGISQPTTEDELRRALQFARDRKLKVACAGERHSMGGQSFTHDGLVLDLRKMNRMALDKEHKTINVQSGARWWQVQELLDKEGLSVKSMQSINIFSVGGTLSINAHGLDPMPGPIAPTVRAMRIMLGNGDVVETSPAENAELFRHALGGYGLFGVILDADLAVVSNEMYSRQTLYVNYTNFPALYRMNVEGNSNVGLVFGRLSVAPSSYLRETAVHIYTKVPFEGSLPPLEPPRNEALTRFIINVSKTGDTGRWLRWTLEKRIEPLIHPCATRNTAMGQPDACQVSRNEEMYDRMAYLKNRLPDTDILQEYFVPCGRMPEFVDHLREIVKRTGANLLNVTIRTIHKDTVTTLPYAKDDMFAFVLYFNVKFNEKENMILQDTTVCIDRRRALSGRNILSPLPTLLFEGAIAAGLSGDR